MMLPLLSSWILAFLSRFCGCIATSRSPLLMFLLQQVCWHAHTNEKSSPGQCGAQSFISLRGYSLTQGRECGLRILVVPAQAGLHSPCLKMVAASRSLRVSMSAMRILWLRVLETNKLEPRAASEWRTKPSMPDSFTENNKHGTGDQVHGNSIWSILTAIMAGLGLSTDRSD